MHKNHLHHLKRHIKNMSALIVEDDPHFQKSLAGFLATLGFSGLRTAQDGNSGWLKYRQSEPDLVITDFDLPGMVGTQLISHILQFRPTQNVILMTRHDTLASVRETHRSSMNIHLISKIGAHACLEGKECGKSFWEPFSRACFYAKVSSFTSG